MWRPQGGVLEAAADALAADGARAGILELRGRNPPSTPLAKTEHGGGYVVWRQCTTIAGPICKAAVPTKVAVSVPK